MDSIFVTVAFIKILDFCHKLTLIHDKTDRNTLIVHANKM